MNRPLSWFPLAGTDPVPGDPSEVRRAGERYAAVATTIAETAGQLETLSEQRNSSSEAVDAVRERAKRTADEIRKAHARYEQVGATLVEYAGSLDRAQDMSVEALRAAQTAQHAVDAATTDVTRASRALTDALEDDEAATAQSRLRRARTARDDAEVALARARAMLEDAVAVRDQAALRAAEAIRSTVDSDGLNDGWWDNWGRSLATAVSKVAGLVATVAGVLALVLCWVPIVGQALAAVAALAGAVALIADIALLAHGEGSVSDVVMGAVGVLSLGAGRVATQAVRSARTSLVTTAARRADRVAPRSGNPAVRADPQRHIPDRLRPQPEAATSWQSWLSDTRNAWGQVRSSRGMDRVYTVLGAGDLVADRRALQAADSLMHRSTLAATAIGDAASAQTRVLRAQGLSAASAGYGSSVAFHPIVDHSTHGVADLALTQTGSSATAHDGGDQQP